MTNHVHPAKNYTERRPMRTAGAVCESMTPTSIDLAGYYTVAAPPEAKTETGGAHVCESRGRQPRAARCEARREEQRMEQTIDGLDLEKYIENLHERAQILFASVTLWENETLEDLTRRWIARSRKSVSVRLQQFLLAPIPLAPSGQRAEP